MLSRLKNWANRATDNPGLSAAALAASAAVATPFAPVLSAPLAAGAAGFGLKKVWDYFRNPNSNHPAVAPNPQAPIVGGPALPVAPNAQNNPALQHDPRRRAEAEAMQGLVGQFGNFFNRIKNPKPQNRHEKAQFPGILQSFFNFFSFAGAESYRRWKNPEADPAQEAEMQNIWDMKKGFMQVHFFLDLIKGFLSIFGGKLMAKISPFFDAISGMLHDRSEAAIQQEVAAGRLDADLVKKHNDSQTIGREKAARLAKEGFKELRNYMQENSSARPQSVAGRRRNRMLIGFDQAASKGGNRMKLTPQQFVAVNADHLIQENTRVRDRIRAHRARA